MTAFERIWQDGRWRTDAGGGGGLPDWWDTTDTPNTVTLNGQDNQADPVLTVQMGADTDNNFPPAIRVTDDDGTDRFYTDGHGNTQVLLDDTQACEFIVVSAQAPLIRAQTSGSGQNRMGFFGASPVERPTGVAVSAPGIHAALVSLGLITA